MKINIKDNIWIEGFDTDYELDGKLDWFTHNPCCDSDDILYFGFTSDISDEFAKKCVCSLFDDSFRDYSKNGVGYESFPFETSKQSIQSACDKLYCIIYKIDNK